MPTCKISQVFIASFTVVALLEFRKLLWHRKHRKSNITDQNKITFLYHKGYDRGIKFIDQIYDDRFQRFYNFSEFKDLYQISEHDYLKYNSLIHNIPKIWKAQLVSEEIVYNHTVITA